MDMSVSRKKGRNKVLIASHLVTWHDRLVSPKNTSVNKLEFNAEVQATSILRWYVIKCLTNANLNPGSVAYKFLNVTKGDWLFDWICVVQRVAETNRRRRNSAWPSWPTCNATFLILPFLIPYHWFLMRFKQRGFAWILISPSLRLLEHLISLRLLLTIPAIVSAPENEA